MVHGLKLPNYFHETASIPISAGVSYTHVYNQTFMKNGLGIQRRECLHRFDET